MTTHAFDTLIYAKKLKKAGFTERQAEAQASALSEVVHQNLATKRDLKELEFKIIFRLSAVIVGVGTFLSGLIVTFH